MQTNTGKAMGPRGLTKQSNFSASEERKEAIGKNNCPYRKTPNRLKKRVKAQDSLCKTQGSERDPVDSGKQESK